MTTDTQNQTASQAYAAQREEILWLLGYLESSLELHRERSQLDNSSWSYAADLGRTRNQLVELIGDLTGLGSERIEKSLAQRP